MTKVFEVVPSREAQGLNLYLRATDGGWVFRIFPVRDPQQARFWCLRVEPCVSASAIAELSSFGPFFVAPTMTREEMMSTLDQIKGETSTWLSAPGQRDLHRWMMAIAELPLPAARNVARPTPDRSRPGVT